MEGRGREGREEKGGRDREEKREGREEGGDRREERRLNEGF